MKLRHAISKIKIVLLELPKMGIGQIRRIPLPFLSCQVFFALQTFEIKVDTHREYPVQLVSAGAPPDWHHHDGPVAVAVQRVQGAEAGGGGGGVKAGELLGMSEGEEKS